MTGENAERIIPISEMFYNVKSVEDVRYLLAHFDNLEPTVVEYALGKLDREVNILMKTRVKCWSNWI